MVSGLPDIIQSIYEAAAFPGRWPALIDSLAGVFGARGGALISQSSDRHWRMASPAVAEIVDRFFEEGGTERNTLWPALLSARHPGFIAITDLFEERVIDAAPVQRDFFAPLGIIGGTATIFPGAGHNAIHLTFDGYGSHGLAAAAKPGLDLLRPHLARALTLSAELEAHRTEALIEHLQMVGVAAAVIGDNLALKAYNQSFEVTLAPSIDTRRGRLRFTDSRIASQFAQICLDSHGGQEGWGSIAVAPLIGDSAPVAMHIIPLFGEVRDLCNSSGFLLILASAKNETLTDTDILDLLFDLTPAEARVARSIGAGSSIFDTARYLSISAATVRTHLKTIFAKTGTCRQAQLVALLSHYRQPIGMPASKH